MIISKEIEYDFTGVGGGAAEFTAPGTMCDVPVQRRNLATAIDYVVIQRSAGVITATLSAPLVTETLSPSGKWPSCGPFYCVTFALPLPAVEGEQGLEV